MDLIGDPEHATNFAALGDSNSAQFAVTGQQDRFLEVLGKDQREAVLRTELGVDGLDRNGSANLSGIEINLFQTSPRKTLPVLLSEIEKLIVRDRQGDHKTVGS